MKIHVDSEGGKERLSWTGPLEIVLSAHLLFAGEDTKACRSHGDRDNDQLNVIFSVGASASCTVPAV